MAISRTAATASDTLSETSYTLMDSMTITPASGDYLAVFSCQLRTATSSSVDKEFDFAIHVGGTIVASSVRTYTTDDSVDLMFFNIVVFADISPNGSQAVTLEHITTGGTNALDVTNRELNLLPYTGTSYAATATGDTTMASGIYADLLTITTPASGDYLCLFGTSFEGPSTAEIGTIIEVGGTVIPHTHRLNEQELSGADHEVPLFTACKVSPNGSQDVVAQWRRETGTGTIAVRQRSLILIPVNSWDIFEASGTVDDADATTTDKRIDDMVLSALDAGDYLVMFSGSDHLGTITGSQGETTYSMRVNGVQVTDSARVQEHEESLDDINLSTCLSGRVTMGAAQDLEIYWQGADTATRTHRERTLVAVREATAGANAPTGGIYGPLYGPLGGPV